MGRLIVFSGAGLSAESGLETFRSANGTWSKHNLDEVCNIATWRDNLAAVHAFYNARREAVGKAQPNSAHRLIADWQRRYETVLLTQNVDDLLERAGCTNVIHLHGQIQELRCITCGHHWSIGYQRWSVEDRCRCGSRRGVKPNVVFFGEDAPNYRVMLKTFAGLRHSDVVLVTGTSGAVVRIDDYLYNARGFKIFNALEPADQPEVYDENFLLPASQAFPQIDQLLDDLLIEPLPCADPSREPQ